MEKSVIPDSLFESPQDSGIFFGIEDSLWGDIQQRVEQQQLQQFMRVQETSLPLTAPALVEDIGSGYVSWEPSVGLQMSPTLPSVYSADEQPSEPIVRGLWSPFHCTDCLSCLTIREIIHGNGNSLFHARTTEFFVFNRR